MNTTELKQAAAPMFSAVVARLSREHSRTEAREVIRAVLDENRHVAGADRVFCANFLMSRLGYGGGF